MARGLTKMQKSGLFWALLGVFLFSLSLPMTKWALESFNTFFTAMARAVIAASIASILLKIRRVPIFKRKDLTAYIYTALGAVFGFPILIAIALTRTTSAQIAVLAAIMPLVTALMAVIRKGEKTSRTFWLASGAGTLILIFFTISRGGAAHQDLTADLLTLGAIFSSSWCYVEGASLTKSYPGWQVISWVVIIALPITFPASIIIWFATHNSHSLTAHGIIGLTFIGVSSMYLGFFAWYKGLSQAGIAHGSQVQQLQALMTLGWSVLLLHEKVSLLTILCAVGVVLSVLIALSSRARQF